MRAESIKGQSPAEIEKALENLASKGYNPTLAIVFISIKQDLDAVCALLDKKGIQIFGATSAGEFVDGNVAVGSIAILLLDINKSHFKVLCENYHGRQPGDVANEMGLAALKIFNNPSFMISNSMTIANGFIDGKTVLNGIESATGSAITIWGGNAGDDFGFTQTIVFTNDKKLENGIIMLVLDADNVDVKGQAAFGWKPAGTVRTITKAGDCIIHTIDNQPALDVVMKFLGLKVAKEEAEKWKPGSLVICLLPEQGAPVMRTSAFFNWDERSVHVNGNIETGDKFRFALPPDFEIVEEVKREAKEMSESFRDADALVMFSCIGRLDELGPMIGQEIEGVRNSFNVPMAGFFAYGEFGRATDGKNEFHNTTCCWVALKEKN